ncbi:hypothetical protein [Streptomyces sp. NPDC059513]|uniref:hypothetical protein n=1 Tax=unclassified Streptomyces TaxID=2593676 RepID=UPI0036A96155
MLCDLISAQAAELERNVSAEEAAQDERAALAHEAEPGRLIGEYVPELDDHRAGRVAAGTLLVAGRSGPMTSRRRRCRPPMRPTRNWRHYGWTSRPRRARWCRCCWRGGERGARGRGEPRPGTAHGAGGQPLPQPRTTHQVRRTAGRAYDAPPSALTHAPRCPPPITFLVVPQWGSRPSGPA